MVCVICRMIFDVFNMCGKINVSILMIELAQSGNSSVNHGCPNQKLIGPGNQATYLLYPEAGEQRHHFFSLACSPLNSKFLLLSE